MKSMHQVLVVLVTGSCLLSACARSAAPAGSAPVAASADAPRDDAASLKNGQTDIGVRDPGKPSAPVDIRASVSGVAKVGEDLPVEIRVTPTSEVDSLDVEISAVEGIALASPSAPASLAARKAGETLSRSISLRPVTEGLFYVRVIAVTRQGDQQLSKVVLVPIKVGESAASAPAKTEGAVKVTPQGEHIISMPASEPPAQPR